ncbi:MAG TPA: hypothetical protein PKD00_01440 [Burkholderiales bacterium]|nr:hypothetical protein [Burkholderiales bacterium]
MLLNSKNKKNNFGPKRATHGVQSATVKALELNKDKNDNFYLTFILNCETGEFSHRIFKPAKSDYATLNEPIETKDSVYWESCDKLADLLARFVLLFDTTTATEDGEISTFFLAYDKFLEDLNKKLKVKVTDKNLDNFGYIKASRKVTKKSNLTGNSYESFEKRIVGTAPNTFYEDGNDPKYAYAQYVGEMIPDYENVEYWNSLFQFIFNYLVDLKNQGQLDSKFMVKLIRVKSYEYEKDSDGKFIKIDDKKVVKATYYNVGVPALTMWFKNPEDNFQLKINSAEQKVINEYESQIKSLTSSDNVEVKDDTDDMPF